MNDGCAPVWRVMTAARLNRQAAEILDGRMRKPTWTVFEQRLQGPWTS